MYCRRVANEDSTRDILNARWPSHVVPGVRVDRASNEFREDCSISDRPLGLNGGDCIQPLELLRIG